MFISSILKPLVGYLFLLYINKTNTIPTYWKLIQSFFIVLFVGVAGTNLNSYGI